MSQRVERTGVFNLSRLSEDLLTAAPDLVRDEEALFTLDYDGTTLVAFLPDGFNVQRFNAVILAHNPNSDSRAQARARRRAAALASIETKLIALSFTPEELSFLGEFINSKNK